MRFRPEISSLGAVKDDSDESLAELGDLVSRHGFIVTGQNTPIGCPPGARLASVLDYCQMRADTLISQTVADHQLERLGEQDAEEMLALAQLTKPGPFSLQTHVLGEYWGIRSEGKLVAMAGERMRQGRFVELSGVCTHPDHLGRGMATSLCLKLTKRMMDRGDIPYLHVANGNDGAIHVYRKLGFKPHQPMVVTVIEPDR
jgi:predicted GNAT family acetyltransferase